MGTEWHILHRGKRRRYVVNRSETKYVSVIQVQRAELCTAEPSCIRQDSLEHRLQVAGRARDDAQHLRGCRLLLQRLGKVIARFAKFAGARFERFLQSASVRLEILYQCGLGFMR